MKIIMYGIVVGLSLLCGCTSDPSNNEQANKLYVEASFLMEKVKSEKVSYTSALASYVRAKELLVSIPTKYPSSNIAVSLLSGEIGILDLSPTELKLMQESLELLANAENNPLSCAHMFSNRIERAEDRERALLEIVGLYSESGQYGLAQNVVDTIGDEFLKSSALIKIAQSYAEEGQKDKVFQLIAQVAELERSIHKSKRKSDVVSDIAKLYATIEDFKKAVEITNFLSDRFMRANTMYEITKIYIEKGGGDEVNQLLDETLSITVTIRDKYARFLTLISIAELYLTIGEESNASRLLSKTLNDIKNSEVIDSRSKMSYLAYRYARAGDRETATHFLDTISKTSATSSTNFNGVFRDRDLSEMAWAYAEVGQINKAVKIIDEIGTDWEKVSTLVRIASAYLDASNNGQAIRFLDQAFDLENKRGVDFFSIHNLSFMATRYAEVGQTDKSLSIMNQLISITASDFLFDSEVVSDVMTDVAQIDITFNIPISTEAKTKLRSIVQTVTPIDNFFRE